MAIAGTQQIAGHNFLGKHRSNADKAILAIQDQTTGYGSRYAVVITLTFDCGKRISGQVVGMHGPESDPDQVCVRIVIQKTTAVLHPGRIGSQLHRQDFGLANIIIQTYQHVESLDRTGCRAGYGIGRRNSFTGGGIGRCWQLEIEWTHFHQITAVIEQFHFDFKQAIFQVRRGQGNTEGIIIIPAGRGIAAADFRNSGFGRRYTVESVGFGTHIKRAGHAIIRIRCNGVCHRITLAHGRRDGMPAIRYRQQSSGTQAAIRPAVVTNIGIR